MASTESLAQDHRRAPLGRLQSDRDAAPARIRCAPAAPGAASRKPGLVLGVCRARNGLVSSSRAHKDAEFDPRFEYDVNMTIDGQDLHDIKRPTDEKPSDTYRVLLLSESARRGPPRAARSDLWQGPRGQAERLARRPSCALRSFLPASAAGAPTSSCSGSANTA